MTIALGVFAASMLTVASAAAASFEQAPSPQPSPASAPAQTARPIRYGPGWNATKCASARAEGQTVSKHDCPDIPAMPVPPKN